MSCSTSSKLLLIAKILSQNSVLCVIFGLALLAGAVSNAVFASDNLDYYDDIFCGSLDLDRDICNDLERLYISEAAAAVSFKSSYVASYKDIHTYATALD